MTKRILIILPLTAVALLFVLAEGGAHLFSLGPAKTLHELVYGRAPGTICVIGRRINPDTPKIANGILPDANFVEIQILGEPDDPNRKLRGLPEPKAEERFDLRFRNQ